MNQFLLSIMINAMSKEDLKAVALKRGVCFSAEEVDYLYPLVKTRWRDFDEQLLSQIEEEMGYLCRERLEALIESLLS